MINGTKLRILSIKADERRSQYWLMVFVAMPLDLVQITGSTKSTLPLNSCTKMRGRRIFTYRSILQTRLNTNAMDAELIVRTFLIDII